MARPAGARNHDFEQKRAALLDTLTDYALSSALTRPSLRQFAIAANQSEPTLRHYFGDRQGLVIEIIGNLNKRAQETWEIAAQPAASPAEAVKDYLSFSKAGMEKGIFNRFHAFALIEAFADDAVGKIYLEQIMEPSLKAFSDKLRSTPGATRNETELRAATLLASAPLLVLGMHQYLLDGKHIAPFDIDETFGLMKDWLAKAFTDESAGAATP